MALFGEIATLKYGGTTVLCVYEMSFGGHSIAEVERTCLGDVSKRFRASQVSEAGTFDFSVYYDPEDATHVAIRSQSLVPLATNPEWIVEYSNGYTHTFDGFVTQATIEGMDQETELSMKVSLRIDGDVVQAAGA